MTFNYTVIDCIRIYANTKPQFILLLMAAIHTIVHRSLHYHSNTVTVIVPELATHTYYNHKQKRHSRFVNVLLTHHEIIISKTLMWMMIRNTISLFVVTMEALFDVLSGGITCERACADLISVLSPRGILLSLMGRMLEGWAFIILSRAIAFEVDVATS